MLFKDEIMEEFIKWKEINKSFYWSQYVNYKYDVEAALAFAKFFAPNLIEMEGCLILEDRYDEEIYKQWKNRNESKEIIEKMMNLYEVKDYFHINTGIYTYEQIEALGNILKYYWGMKFKNDFPNRNIKVDVFEEEYQELYITIYESK